MKGGPMGYKTILVHVDDSTHVDERIRIAAGIAATEGAHLIGAAMTGISRFVYRTTDLNENDPNLGAHMELLRERARSALAAFEPEVKRLGISSYEKRLIRRRRRRWTRAASQLQRLGRGRANRSGRNITGEDAGAAGLCSDECRAAGTDRSLRGPLRQSRRQRVDRVGWQHAGDARGYQRDPAAEARKNCERS